MGEPTGGPTRTTRTSTGPTLDDSPRADPVPPDGEPAPDGEPETGLRGLLFRWAQVPRRPEPPPGDPAELRVFRAGQNYLRYKVIGWGLGQLVAFGFLLTSTVGLGILNLPLIGAVNGIEQVDAAIDDLSLAWLSAGVILLTWGIFVVQAVFSFVALRLNYEMRWYMLSDRALRIRHGVFSVREQTMTYANIQQISVRRGPLQKLLGLGDVEVRTAGGGGAGGSGGPGAAKAAQKDLHRGFFKGVADPEGVRDAIRSRVERYREAGLGDPDDTTYRPAVVAESGGGPAARNGEPETVSNPGVLASARILRHEVGELRRGVTAATRPNASGPGRGRF